MKTKSLTRNEVTWKLMERTVKQQVKLCRLLLVLTRWISTISSKEAPLDLI